MTPHLVDENSLQRRAVALELDACKLSLQAIQIYILREYPQRGDVARTTLKDESYRKPPSGKGSAQCVGKTDGFLQAILSKRLITV
jgi:hypothetical protein